MECKSIKPDAGQFCGLLLKFGNPAAEVFVPEPASQGPAAYVGEAGGLGYGCGGCQDGYCLFLTDVEVGLFIFRAIVSQNEPVASVAGS